MWLWSEVQLPGEPWERVCEGMLPEAVVVTAGRISEAGIDSGPGRQCLEGAGRLQRQAVLCSCFKPTGHPGEALVFQQILRVMGVVVGQGPPEERRNGRLGIVLLLGGRGQAGVDGKGRILLGIVQGDNRRTHTASGRLPATHLSVAGTVAYVAVMVFGMILIVGTRFLLHRGPSLKVDIRVDPNLGVEDATELVTVESPRQPLLRN